MTVLDRIVETKRAEVAALAGRRDELRAAARDAAPAEDFTAAIRSAPGMAVIAEVKKASPSAGVIREDFDPVAIATTYEAAGAACVSVLTDGPYFQGAIDDLVAVRAAVGLPVIRKDFVIDPVQINEARAAGADCVLLIAECLPGDELRRLYEAAGEAGIQTLIELYEEANVDRVLDLGPPLVGVNNRDLRTFTVDTNHSVRLRAMMPESVTFVSESGIRTGEETAMLRGSGVDAVLVGETLMRADDPAAKLRELAGGEEAGRAASDREGGGP